MMLACVARGTGAQRRLRLTAGSDSRSLSRRDFLGAVAAMGAVAGCRTFSLAGGDRPLLRIGVVSDVHIRLAKGGEALEDGYGTETFEKALEYFRDQGADAVVIAGDMADSGLAAELKAVADTWYRVFPDDRAPDGRKVERVFTFGNHDAYGPWSLNTKSRPRMLRARGGTRGSAPSGGSTPGGTRCSRGPFPQRFRLPRCRWELHRLK